MAGIGGRLHEDEPGADHWSDSHHRKLYSFSNELELKKENLPNEHHNYLFDCHTLRGSGYTFFVIWCGYPGARLECYLQNGTVIQGPG